VSLLNILKVKNSFIKEIKDGNKVRPTIKFPFEAIEYSHSCDFPYLQIDLNLICDELQIQVICPSCDYIKTITHESDKESFEKLMEDILEENNIKTSYWLVVHL